MKDLVAAVTFTNSKGEINALRIPLSAQVRKELDDILCGQYKSFIKLDKVEFSGTYKNEDDERFYIQGYDDPDKTINAFNGILSGLNTDTLTKVDDLSRCNAFLYCIPQLPDLILIQRFTNHYFADRDKFYGLLSGNTVAHITSSAFAFPSKITGIYDKSSRELSFLNVQSIRSALPGFADNYVPVAKNEDVKTFLSNECFDQDSVKSFRSDIPARAGRLFWLLIDSRRDIKSRLSKFKKYDAELNMRCFKDGKIVLSNDYQRLMVTLRILLGDVFKDDGVLYLSNSKQKIKSF